MPIPDWRTISPQARRQVAMVAVATAAVLWATWSILAEMANRWEHDPTYSHGYLVPLTALVILWLRRDRRPDAVSAPPWWPLGLFALGLAMQVGGAIVYVRWLSGASIVAYTAGIAALVGGARGLLWASPAILFLFFMIPLPFRFENLMRYPLQRVSTIASAFVLQTLGLTAYAQGNIINLTDASGHTIDLGVIDACSGLKMLIVFFCLTTAVAILIDRPIGERLLILLSTLPIALACNIARITTTGVAHVVLGEWWANKVFHDWAGWLMMPLALSLLWLELKLLGALFIDETPDRDPVFHMSGHPPTSPHNVPRAT
jgi:exosortase